MSGPGHLSSVAIVLWNVVSREGPDLIEIACRARAGRAPMLRAATSTARSALTAGLPAADASGKYAPPTATTRLSRSSVTFRSDP